MKIVCTSFVTFIWLYAIMYLKTHSCHLLLWQAWYRDEWSIPFFFIPNPCHASTNPYGKENDRWLTVGSFSGGVMQYCNIKNLEYYKFDTFPLYLRYVKGASLPGIPKKKIDWGPIWYPIREKFILDHAEDSSLVWGVHVCLWTRENKTSKRHEWPGSLWSGRWKCYVKMTCKIEASTSGYGPIYYEMRQNDERNKSRAQRSVAIERLDCRK